MAFLFKSKKNNPDRALSSRDGPPSASAQSFSAAARIAREEKSSLQRSTPTGSLNSLDNDGSAGSPDQGAFAVRRPPNGDQTPQPPSQPQPQPPSQIQPPPQQPPPPLTPQQPPQLQLQAGGDVQVSLLGLAMWPRCPPGCAPANHGVVPDPKRPAHRHPRTPRCTRGRNGD